ncbi:MAG: hypothetical protein V3U29_03340, partial [Phycisphaeraceae bacterium]
MKRCGTLILIALLVCFIAAEPSIAQLQNLDKTTLYDGLAKEGMTELLLHLLETAPPDDPVLTRTLQIAQLRVRYADAKRLADGQAQAFEALRDGLSGIVEDFYDHEQRPLWQTDLAELLLFEQLAVSGRSAAAFYEFGVTDADQRRMFEANVPRALAELTDADRRFFELQSLLPREPDHVSKRVNTGLWDRMIQAYWKRRTRYYLANAAYYAALLGDDHPYFANLGRHPRISQQEKSISQERARLLSLAIQSLEPFVTDQGDDYGDQLRLSSQALRGRCLRAQGRLDDAIAAYDTVIGHAKADLTDLVAHLAKADALARKGQPDVAVNLLKGLTTHALAQQNLLYRLLVVDALHRMMLRRAEGEPPDRRAAAVAGAYQPYVKLLGDPALGDHAVALRNYMYRRWDQSIGAEADLAPLPPVVIVGMAGVARRQGQNLMIDAAQAAAEGNAQRAEQLAAQAAPRLERAIRLLAGLSDRDDLAPAMRAQVAYNRGLAAYYRATSDPAAAVEAAGFWIDLADRMPDQPDAERAIELAETVLRQWRGQPQVAPAVHGAYERAVSVLFSNFPATRAADDARLYYGVYVLMPADRFAAAADVLAAVPYGHETYYEAHREKLFCLLRVYQAAEAADQDAARRRLVSAARRLWREAQAARTSADSGSSYGTSSAIAGARLVLADVAADEGELDEAVALLQGIEPDDDAPDPAMNQLMIDSLAKRIMVLVDADRLDAVPAEAGRMMQAHPDTAAGVVSEVLNRLELQIDNLRRRVDSEVVAARKKHLLDQARSKAEVASKLAVLLTEWARNQGFDDQQMLPYHLITAKALRLADRPGRARDLLEPMLAQAPDNADVLHQLAETYFALAQKNSDDQMFLTAAGYYDRLINGLVPDDSGRYPAIWWNAWMRRLQIMDARGEFTQDIPLTVR